MVAEFLINGRDLTIEQVVHVADEPTLRVSISPHAIPAINRAADAVQQFIREGHIAYGITTGFGAFKDKLIPLRM
jgi:histidine ammonia-lyase